MKSCGRGRRVDVVGGAGVGKGTTGVLGRCPAGGCGRPFKLALTRACFLSASAILLPEGGLSGGDNGNGVGIKRYKSPRYNRWCRQLNFRHYLRQWHPHRLTGRPF